MASVGIWSLMLSDVYVLGLDFGQRPDWVSAVLTMQSNKSLICVPISNEKSVFGWIYSELFGSDQWRRLNRQETPTTAFGTVYPASPIQKKMWGEVNNRQNDIFARKLKRTTFVLNLFIATFVSLCKLLLLCTRFSITHSSSLLPFTICPPWL
jgi:hypothetical protein